MKKRKDGFTMIEVVVVIAILSILVGLAIVGVGNIEESASNATLGTSAHNIYSYMVTTRYAENFDDEHFFTYIRNGVGSVEYFSRFLEIEWEILNEPGDEDNTNNINAANLVSKKTGIVNWNNPTALGELYQNQAVYITDSDSASYIEGSPDTVDDCYCGSVVIWYDDADASNVYVYYVDTEGKQSEKYYCISRF
jgi:prepilin-type N-terminal cleavage/methylation domain-containing protein